MSKRRKHIPLAVKVDSLLILLGFDPDEDIEWDHHPALVFRVYDPMTGKYDPDELDPRFIRPLRKAAHRKKTSGRAGEQYVTSYGSDAHAARKMRHLTAQQQEFVSRLLAKEPGEKRPASKWGSRPLQSRGFEKPRKSAERRTP